LTDVAQWSGNSNQVYPALVQLHKDGLVESQVRQKGNYPPSKVYSLTPAGEATLKEWVTADPAAPQMRNPFLTQLAWADGLGDEGEARRGRVFSKGEISTAPNVHDGWCRAGTGCGLSGFRRLRPCQRRGIIVTARAPRSEQMLFASVVTGINALVASGYSIAGLVSPQSILPTGVAATQASHVFALCAAARTIPLAVFGVIAIYRRSRCGLLVLGRPRGLRPVC